MILVCIYFSTSSAESFSASSHRTQGRRQPVLTRQVCCRQPKSVRSLQKIGGLSGSQLSRTRAGCSGEADEEWYQPELWLSAPTAWSFLPCSWWPESFGDGGVVPPCKVDECGHRTPPPYLASTGRCGVAVRVRHLRGIGGFWPLHTYSLVCKCRVSRLVCCHVRPMRGMPAVILERTWSTWYVTDGVCTSAA